MKKTTKKQKNREHFNDLLLPVIFTLCVLPFVVYLAEYDYGYSKYLWHSDNSIMQDFYTYYRAIIFLFIVFFAVVILLFRLGIYREKTKPWKQFIPLAVYGVMVILSALFSVNPKAAWLGNFVGYEGVFVLLGYCIMAFYAYQILETEKDYRSVSRALPVMFLLMSVVGWFQVFKHDLLNYEWVQKIVMPDILYEHYGGMVEDLFTGNNVFLTLYNPNFAAVFLVMCACVFAVFFLEAKEKKEKVIYGLFLLDAIVLCWFTYTRAAFVGIAAAFAVLAVCFFGKKKKGEPNGKEWLDGKNRDSVKKTGQHTEKTRKIPSDSADKSYDARLKNAGKIGTAMVLFFVAMFVFDMASGGKFIGRLFDEKKSSSLESIVTLEDGVQVTYEGNAYKLMMGEILAVYDTEGNRIPLDYSEENGYVMPFSDDCYADVMDFDGENRLFLYIEDYTLEFTKQEDGYYYVTEWGKLDRMEEIPHADFGGLEYLGSGRLYIWSRILPMLKNYIVIGSGPDTFAEVFPQNDYAGKLVYAESTARIMERAHNDYLMRWVQTGLVSLLALLVFYILFFKKCFAYYRRCRFDNAKNKLGFGCFLGCVGYLACSFFSDSTLYTTPTFYVFMGIALAAASEETVSLS